MKFKEAVGRVPRFRQIMRHGDTIAALAADAGNDTGTVWVFIPGGTYGAVGWLKLTNAIVEEDKS